MSDRLDAYLDGELPSDDLSADERAQAAAFDARVGAMRAALAADRPADMDVRVMRRIAELGLEPLPARRDGVVRRMLGALWAEHSITLRWRPAYAGAALAAAMLVLVWLTPALRRPVSDVARMPVAADSGAIYVQFRLHTASASNVALAGSFSDWKPVHSLQEVAEGVWVVVLPIQPGVHDYAFVIDGERWIPDPYAPQVEDGFGGRNSRLTLLAPTTL